MMFKIFFLVSFLAMALAKPGYIHSAPIVTSYHAVPAVHVVRPIYSAHHSISTPLIHHHHHQHSPSLIHHGSYHHHGFH